MSNARSAVIFTLLVVALAGCLVFIWKGLPAKNTPPTPPTTTVAPPPVILPPTTVTETPPTEPTPPVKPATTVRTPPVNAICDADNFICVDKSYQNALLTNPIVVTGTAIAFENQFSWKLTYQSAGKEVTLVEGSAYANAPDMGKSGPFQIRAFIPRVTPQPSTGKLVLYEASAKDGSPTHVVSIPVKLPTKSVTATIYFSDQYAARDGDCSKTTAVKVQMLQTITPIEATLRRLLQEDSTSEIANEFIASQIPDGSELQSLNLSKDGIATAVFNSQFNSGGGSCHVAAVRAQIEATLKQFPSVKKVVISVEGKTPEETLQP